MQLQPIFNLAQLLQNWDLFKQKEYPFYACLLYTDQDVEIAEYIKKNYNEVDRMSGRSCLVFAIEKPPEEDKDKILPMIKDNSNPFFYDLSKKQSHPFDKTMAYEIANHLGVGLDNFPCVVLFKDIKEDEPILFKISQNITNDEFTEFFRNLFTLTIYNNERDDGLKHVKNGMRNKKIKKIIMKELSKISIAGMFAVVVKIFTGTSIPLQT